jgi:DNA invertase Pin-like site-specific DNA recombinase
VVAAYVRVSSRSQNHAAQRSAIEQAARARGDRVRRWFSEKQSSRKLDRPALAELVAAARRGRVRKLYVFRIDRLSRSGIRSTLALLETLREAGCSVVTVADGFDLEGPGAELVLAMIAWAAKQERDALGERIRAARARVEAKGGAWGRPRRAFDVARARELRRHGRSVRYIAAALKVPKSTLAIALSRKPTPKTPSPASRKTNGQRGVSR